MVLGNVVGLNLWRASGFERPALGVLAVMVLVTWTAYALWAYAAAHRRVAALLGADLAVGVAAILVSPLAKGADLQATVPGFWVMGPMIAWAIRWGLRGGLVAAAALAVADLAVRSDFTQTTYGNVFLLLIGGPILGYVSDSLQQMAVQRDRAERAAAAAAERARLARAVHDGVLQVLALVQRRGAEAGGELAVLGRQAADQEAALRALIRQQDSQRAPAGAETVDVAAALHELETVRPPAVTVATPGMPVPLPAATARELVAAVRACLDNVAAHVGPDSPAWVLLDDVGQAVTVTVRDEGPGIADGRLDEAAAQGRLGVSESIRGRLRDLGGSAALATGTFGTQWELTVPRGPRVTAADGGSAPG